MKNVVITLSILTLTACETVVNIEEKKQELSNEIVKAETTHDFTYLNQDSWHFESGDMQSPINVNTSEILTSSEYGHLKLDYLNSLTYIKDTGHSIQAGVTGTALLGNRTFNLEQVHFHSQSEHTIDGEHSPLEAHFVHKAEDGRLAVVAVLFDLGEENQDFQVILDNFKPEDSLQKEDAIDININGLLPENKGYYHYLGSLTTPPLSENVEWYIFTDKVEISEAQLKQFNTYYEGNNRNLQELNHRSVLYYSEN